MNCPKCNYTSADEHHECPSCGVVFAKARRAVLPDEPLLPIRETPTPLVREFENEPERLRKHLVTASLVIAAFVVLVKPSLILLIALCAVAAATSQFASIKLEAVKTTTAVHIAFAAWYIPVLLGFGKEVTGWRLLYAAAFLGGTLWMHVNPSLGPASFLAGTHIVRAGSLLFALTRMAADKGLEEIPEAGAMIGVALLSVALIFLVVRSLTANPRDWERVASSVRAARSLADKAKRIVASRTANLRAG